MPRVNLGRNLRDEAIVRLVWGSAEVERIDRKQLASYAGVSLRTIHERRKKPGGVHAGRVPECLPEAAYPHRGGSRRSAVLTTKKPPEGGGKEEGGEAHERLDPRP